ncbi:FMRFamide receptor-like [Physella acuta]|uniref:FMRFamide receptor-like n=1 Tax=Physella acuta TaxID=109671 RepID=UPI0027DE06F7|nr:FMRFamide receptor-like [Physella acuta]
MALDSQSTTDTVNPTVPHPAVRDSNPDQTLVHIYAAMFFIVNPSVAGAGLLTNSLGLLVLVRSGMRRTSNIFLLGLTLADSMFLLGGVAPTGFLQYTFNARLTYAYIGWRYPYPIAYSIHIIHSVFTTVTNLGLYTSTTLPAVISVERCFAIFLPLKFKQIMTTNKAIFIIILVFIAWLPWILFWQSCLDFFYYPLGGNKFTGVQQLSPYCTSNYNIVHVFDDYVLNYLSSVFLVTIIVVGSLLVSVKIRLTHATRKKLSSRKSTHPPRTTRTTRTLLAVSLIFSITNFIYFVVVSVMSEQMEENSQLNLAVNACLRCLNYLSSSSNFYVYIFLNKNFKSIFIALFRVENGRYYI